MMNYFHLNLFIGVPCHVVLMKSAKAKEHFPKVCPASCYFHTSSIKSEKCLIICLEYSFFFFCFLFFVFCFFGFFFLSLFPFCMPLQFIPIFILLLLFCCNSLFLAIGIYDVM
jgi:hypothetical protein